MFTVVSYDIVDDKRRTKVFKLLKGYGAHVQFSVFECELDDGQLARLKVELLELVDPHLDSVRLYQLDAKAVRAEALGGLGGWQRALIPKVSGAAAIVSEIDPR
jgi:CRISPR-associated protein Cas2